jgi:hypothetical protein
MAKPLTQDQPSSAVARLLEPGVGRAALQEASRGRGRAEAEPTGETPTIKREFILTPQADETLKHLVDVFSRATGTQVTNSHLLRAALKALAEAMPAIERGASELGRLKRPSNARGREAERERYEEAIARALSQASRNRS